MRNLLVCLALVSVTSNQALACSCSELPTVYEALEKADLVFEGTVTNVERTDKKEKASFKVQRTWKGVPAKSALLETAPQVAMCDYEFTVKKRYVVYATKKDGVLTTDICSRTKLSKDAKEDIHDLGTTRAVEKPGCPAGMIEDVSCHSAEDDTQLCRATVKVLCSAKVKGSPTFETEFVLPKGKVSKVGDKMSLKETALDKTELLSYP